ncbi:zn- ring domain containing protein, partial [Cystoisospora suis]
MPTRHSKNATSAAFYSYHERRKLKDVGSQVERLDTNALRRFEACWLCNRTAISPVCTPQGLLFCKQCLFFNFEDQKKKMQKELKEWDLHQQKRRQMEALKKEEEESVEQRKFLEEEGKISSDYYYSSSSHSQLSSRGKDARNTHTNTNGHQGDSSSSSSSSSKATHSHSTHAGRGESLLQGKAEARAKNFWIAENTPSADCTQVKKPSKSLKCPITRKPLKLKQLVYIKPELIDDKDTEFNRWVCAISKKAITNQNAAVVIPTGDVVLMVYIYLSI